MHCINVRKNIRVGLTYLQNNVDQESRFFISHKTIVETMVQRISEFSII